MTFFRSILFLVWLLLPFFLFAQPKGIIPYRQARITIPYENNFTIKQADSLIATDTANPDYYDLRALLYFQLNRVQDAYDDYTKAITLDKDESTFINIVGYSLLRLKCQTRQLLISIRQ